MCDVLQMHRDAALPLEGGPLANRIDALLRRVKSVLHGQLGESRMALSLIEGITAMAYEPERGADVAALAQMARERLNQLHNTLDELGLEVGRAQEEMNHG